MAVPAPGYAGRSRYAFPLSELRVRLLTAAMLLCASIVQGAHAHTRRGSGTPSAPGHTKGNTTWTWVSCEGARCLHMVDVGSLSAPGFRLLGNPKYPNVVEDFEHSFAVVAALPCDFQLAPHPEMVDFWARVAKRKRDALIDPTGCRAYAKDARESFEAQLAKQRSEAVPAKQRRRLAKSLFKIFPDYPSITSSLEEWLSREVCEVERKIEIRPARSTNGHLTRIYVTEDATDG